MPRAAAIALLATVLAAGAVCLAEKFHNEPGGGGGGITLKVSPIERLERAVVVEPTEYKAYLARIDKGSGTVSVSGLPAGKYDLLLKFDTTVVEGLRLDVPGDFEKLSTSDCKGIDQRIFASEPVFNKKHIARCAGNARRVKMLIEHVRDQKTYQPDGTVLAGIMIRRIELCEMRKTGRIWQIKKSKHLFREERRMGGAGTKLKFAYTSKLGGIRVGDETVKLPDFSLSGVQAESKPYFHRATWKEK